MWCNNKLTVKLMTYKKHWYHTIDHVDHLYDLYYTFRNDIKKVFPNINESELFEVFDYHDIVYIPGNEYNELFAAEIYKQNAYEVNQNVYECILSTKEGSELKTDLEKLMHDLDWFYLAEDNFEENNQLVINEYVEKGNFDKDVVISKRKEWLKELLNKDVFVTDLFKSYNNKVKENIKEYLK